MKFAKVTMFVLVAMFAFVSNATAQKFGYVNSQQILAEYPQAKTADNQLATYQKQLISKGESMVKSFEADYKDFATKAQSGTLSQVQMQQKEKALGEKQQAIQKYEIEVKQKIAKKRQDLIKPILDKVQNAIEAVGKENGYTMIFDTASGTILHAQDSDDVTAKVKAKLGF